MDLYWSSLGGQEEVRSIPCRHLHILQLILFIYCKYTDDLQPRSPSVNYSEDEEADSTNPLTNIGLCPRPLSHNYANQLELISCF
jgi:hypothetical protein